MQHSYRNRGMDMKNEKYIIHQRGDVKWLTFPELDAYPELVHAFTTRYSGVSTGEKSSWNFGKGPDETWDNILENYRILGEVLSEEAGSTGGSGTAQRVDREHMVRTDQTHTANVLKVTEEHLGMGITRPREYTDIDGLVTNLRGITLITSHGDCNALFFYDPVEHAIGLAHSGWKGTLQEIGAEVIRMMGKEYGSQPEDIIVGIGPALCQTCFEVDEDVAQMFYQKNPAWRAMAFCRDMGVCGDTGETKRKHYIDLKAVVRETLLRRGVQAENIHDMKLCTKCGPGAELFYSYRRQKGKNGNMVSAMMLRG